MSKENNKKYITIFSIIAVVMIVIDQITKRIVDSKMQYGEKKDIIEGFFSFNYVRNKGSAFSFLANKSWGIYILSAISLIMAVVIFIALVISAKRRLFIIATSMTLLFAGAVGNLIDRFVLRYVIDFIRFDFGSYTFPVFNVADICAVCGSVLLLIIIIFCQKQTDEFFNAISRKKSSKEDITKEEENA